MASFTDRSPATFSQYIPTRPVQAMVTVGLEREEAYRVGVQRVQQQLNSIADVSNNLVRPQARQYMSQKLQEVTDQVNASAGQDFSDPSVYQSLISKAASVGTDPLLANEIQGSIAYHNKVQQIQTLKEKNPELYSQFNEQYAMMDLNAWANSSSPVGERLVDRRPFTPYYDRAKETQDAIDRFLKQPDEFVTEQLLPDGTTKKVTYKGKTSDQLRLYLDAVLSDKAKNQMVIEGTVMGTRLSNGSFIQQYQQDLDDQISRQKQDIDQLSTALLRTDNAGEKNALSRTIAQRNRTIESLERQKSDPEAIRSALENKADYFGQLYAKQTINSIAANSANRSESITWGSNPAIVKQLDRAFEAQMTSFKEQQQNIRNAAGINAANERAALDRDQQRYLKFLELGMITPDGRLANPGFSGAALPGASNQGALAGQPGSTGRVDLPVGRTNQTEVIETGREGYDRFVEEKDDLLIRYNDMKKSLISKMDSDPTWQKTLASLMGIGTSGGNFVTPMKPLEPGQNIINQFDLTGAKKWEAVNKVLEVKEEEWLKGKKVEPSFENFFKESHEIRMQIDARDNFQRAEKSRAIENLQKDGFRPVVIDGRIISLEDMVDYVSTGSNRTIESTKRMTITTSPTFVSTGIGGGMVGASSRTHKGVDIPAELKAQLDRVRNSKALDEYKNSYNESFGTESRPFTLIYADKNKNKISQRDFGIVAGKIINAYNQKKGVIIPIDALEPTFLGDSNTGVIQFSWTTGSGEKKVRHTDKIEISEYKNPLTAEDRKYSQALFYGRGQTPYMTIPGLRPMKVSIQSTSTDPSAQYTVNTDGTPAKYFVRDEAGNIINDTMGGFHSPTAAVQFVTELANSMIQKKLSDWYVQQSKNPNFVNLSQEEKARLAESYVNSIDPASNIQTLSNNPYMNMVGELDKLVQKQNQNNQISR